MRSQYAGTAAAFEFASRPPIGFETLVGEFDRKLPCAGGGPSHLTRDGDDIAIFDRGPIRVALGWVAPGRRKKNWYLIMVIGPSPEPSGPVPDDAAIRAIANKVLTHAQTRFPTDSIYRCDIDRQIDSDLIDFMTEAVLSTSAPSATPPGDAQMDSAEEQSDTRICETPHVPQVDQRADEAEAPAAPKAVKPAVKLKNGRLVRTAPGAQSRHSAAQGSEDEYDRAARIRQILTEFEPEQAISLPMHLTLYTFSLSMLLQVPSVGAAMLVYNILREDGLPFSRSSADKRQDAVANGCDRAYAPATG